MWMGLAVPFTNARIPNMQAPFMAM